MLERLLPLLAASALALPATALAAPDSGADAARAPSATLDDDVPPKDDEKKNEVTVWVLDASGKG